MLADCTKLLQRPRVKQYLEPWSLLNMIDDRLSFDQLINRLIDWLIDYRSKWWLNTIPNTFEWMQTGILKLPFTGHNSLWPNMFDNRLYLVLC